MSVIAAFIQNPTRAQRLHAAVRDTHHVVPCANWDELFRACGGQLIRVAVLELDAIASGNFDAVRRLKRHAPAMALVAYATLAPDRIRQIFDAGRYGFEDLVVADLDDGPTAFGRALERAAARGVAGLVRGVIPAGCDPLARDALLLAVSRAHERLTPATLAAVLGVAPRRLARALSGAGHPPPHRLLVWGRLLVAGSLMDDSRRSADRIAITLGFPSGSAFRNTCRRYLGARPSEIRARGGARFVAERFRLELVANT